MYQDIFEDAEKTLNENNLTKNFADKIVSLAKENNEAYDLIIDWYQSSIKHESKNLQVLANKMNHLVISYGK